MTYKFILYDLTINKTLKFKNKIDLLIEIQCIKDNYTHVIVNQIDDKNYEITYYD